MKFDVWLDTFVEEKGYDTEQIFEVEGDSGTNYIPLGCVLEAMKHAPKHEQNTIKNKVVQLDFHNADVLDFFKHLAKAIARQICIAQKSMYNKACSRRENKKPQTYIYKEADNDLAI